MGKKSAPAPPDYSSLSESSEKAAELSYKISQEQLAWSKEMWSEQKETVNTVLDTQMEQMGEQWQIAKDDRARYEEMYLPMEEQYLQKAQDWDSDERRGEEVAKAQTEVGTQFDAARQNALQRLESYGIDPSQTRSQALDLGVRMEQAKATAGAANNARTQIEKEGMGMMGESINVGRGMASQGLNYAASSQNAGNSAGNTASSWQGAGNSMGSPTAWNSAGNQSTQTGVSAKNAQFSNSMDSYNATQANSAWNTVAGLAGAGMGATGFAEGGEARAPESRGIPEKSSTGGGYNIPETVVRRKGSDYFDKMIEKGINDEKIAMRKSGVMRQALALPSPEALQ